MKYPFKFLDAYNHKDKEIFFGREEEIEAMYKMVFQTNLMLVYGASGTGKTSLIRCGLANKFTSSQWLDLYVRREGDINKSLLENIKKRIPERQTETVEDEDDWFEELIEEAKEDIEEIEFDETNEFETEEEYQAYLEKIRKQKERKAAEKEAESLLFESENPIAEALNELYLATFTPIYLILDQFEEIYTLGNREEQVQIIETIKELIQLQLPVKIIISIREEYLIKLYELEKEIPQLRDKRLRIEPMNIGKAESVILNATNHELTNEKPNKNANVFLQKGEEKAIAEAVIDKIREDDVDIQLPYLQAFMDRLYIEATGESIGRTTSAILTLEMVNKLGEIGDVLVDFLNQQTKVIREKLQQKYRKLPDDIVWNVLSSFATANGTKKPIRQADFGIIQENLANNNFKISNIQTFIKDAITELESSRILRFRRESQTYEVYHDTLAKQIAEKRSEDEKAYLKAKRIVTDGLATFEDTNTLLSKEQLAFVKPYEERIKSETTKAEKSYIQSSERKIKRQRFVSITALVAVFLIGAYVVFSTLEQNRKLANANENILKAQEKTNAALADFEAEKAKRETKELKDLMEDAQRIVGDGSTDNCPPKEMIQRIDTLYVRYGTVEEQFASQYQKTQTRLKVTDCY